MFESRISAGATEKLPEWKNLTQRRLRAPHDMEGHPQKNALRDSENWQTKWRNCTKIPNCLEMLGIVTNLWT